ncbi:polysaccharide biosynthesis protein [Methanospirillum hungatei JF-1]|uniref:Polysaccharide biosynthesis protein n=1 Tax=Methanospirillum hungatei JF-1 (strain ATCC 27890 / DSM 864 / NBRC 100397 / JF-1) TaxID=323259 RepID=Q2FT18_METHJ|nr:oligosaccharide flippase family protein [Methanospirillum hungatei]ABD42079.1 polysaccharide biosynthesis protein [Methanospirillum hungatei JF-1]
MSQDRPRKSSPFAKDVFTLVTGTAFAQLIGIIASPLLTRLYGPESFGLLALFTSITGIIGVIACMRYELAIMLPKDDEDAVNLLGLCIIMVTIITGLTAIGLLLGGDALFALLNARDLAPYLWLIPPFIFISGLFLALNYWNSRTRHYGRLSIARVTSVITSTGAQLGAGFAGYATGGSLIGASLAGSAISTGILGGQIWRDDGAYIKEKISWKGMIYGLKRYKKFPLLDSTSALLNTISWQLPVLLLSAFFSPVIVGFYALGMRVLQTPMSLIGGAIAQVFFQRAAEDFHKGTLSILMAEVFDVLLKIGVFPMLLLTITGWDLFTVIFGDTWGEAGIYAQLLGIWAIFWFISSPLSTILSVTENLRMGFFLTILNLSTRISSLLIGGFLGNIYIAIALFSFSGVLVYGFGCLIFLHYAGLKISSSLNMIIKVVVFSFLFLIPLLIFKIMKIPPLIISIIALVSCIIYYSQLFITDTRFRNILTALKRHFEI